MEENPAGAGDAPDDGESDEPASLVDQLAKGAGVGFAGRIGGKVLAVLVQILLTRVLGPSQYGLYVLGENVVGVVRMFAQLGLRQGAIRYGSIHFEDEDGAALTATLVASVLVSAVSGIAAAALIYLLADRVAVLAFDDPSLTPVLRLFAFALPFYVLLELASAYFQAFKRIDREQILTNAVRPVVNLALVGGAFLLGFRLHGAVAGYVLTGAVTALVGFYLLVVVQDAPLNRRGIEFDRETTVRLLSFSLPMMLIALSTHLATRVDRLMLGMFGSAESVGLYNVAAMVALQFSVVISSLLAIYKPIVADVHANGEEERIPDLYATVTKWISYGTLALFVVTTSFAGPILSVFGTEFTAGREVLYVLPLLYVAGALFGPCGALLTMTGRERIEVVNGALLVGLNVALNYVLIPIYGALGAAAAVVIAGTVTNAVQVAVIYVLHGFHPFDADHLLFVGVAVAVAVTAVRYVTTLPLLSRVLACGALLAVCGALFYRQVDDAERDLFESVLDSR